MKSIVMKSIYTGLGLIGTGTESAKELGRKIAAKAEVSEKEGEKLARKLQTHSEKAIRTLSKTLEKEVQTVVDALHAAAKEHPTPVAKKPKTKKAKSAGKKKTR